MIVVENLCKYFGPVTAIEDISFTAERGDILGFLGPNGAGKTTTMRILTGFMPASRGKASVAGFDIFTQSLDVRKHIGYLPENVPLYTDMSVSAYLLFVAEIKGVAKQERQKQIDKVMEECGIRDVAHRLVGKLSKGYRQRVGLAQALLNDPDVLILDEPTSGLDPKQIIEIRELIKHLAGQKTVILCTHILPEVSMICNRVIIINQGKLVAMDTPENLTTQVQQSSQILLTVEGPPDAVTLALRQVPGVLTVKQKDTPQPAGVGTYLVESERKMDIRKDLSWSVFEHHWGLLELRAVNISLEEVFVHLVTEEEEGEA
jgi:ABC-2 type transport system ATP-binding protein